MPVERIIAVDFGTSTSVVRVKRYQDGQPMGDRLETKPVTFNMGSTVVPTLIQKRDTQESLYFGYDAEIPHRNTEICRNFKIEIENPDPAIQERARGLTAEFFGFLFKTYREQSLGGHLGEGSDQERTIISYPVKWSEETKAFMLETARKAGFPNVEGQDEAQAAIQAVTVQSEQQLRERGYFVAGMPVHILLIDMGAGTTDLVLCRHTPGDTPQTEILSTWPHGASALFGGREVDELLRSYIKSLLPVEEADKILKTLGVDKFKAWKEHEVSPALARGETVDYFSALDDRLDALEMDVDYSISLDRQAFEDFTQGYLRGLPELINGCLQKAGVSGDVVDLVIVTGGHSQWYFVREILSGRLNRFGDMGLQKIQADPGRIVSIALPHETVALGMTYSPLRVTMPKPAPKQEPTSVAEQEQKSPQIITPMPPVLHTSRLLRPDPPVRPVLPGKDANREKIKAFYRDNRSLIASNHDTPNIILADGTVAHIQLDGAQKISYGTQKNVVGIACEELYGGFSYLLENGTVYSRGQAITGFSSIVSVKEIVGGQMGLRENGTVVTNGKYNHYGMLNVQNWENIVAMDTGLFHTVGLKSDGTVIAVGRNSEGQCNTQNWRNIVAVACGSHHTTGLQADGRVVAAGENKDGECNVQDWQDIVSICTVRSNSIGLRENGTLVTAGRCGSNLFNVQSWENVIAVYPLGDRTFAILDDGSVIYTDFLREKRFLIEKHIPRPAKTLPFKLF